MSEPAVAIVGNGPVGQTAALLLARWGVRCVLLDQRPQRDLVGSKAICQQRDALDVWESVGARVAVEGATWTTARTFYQRAELFTFEYTDPGRSPLPPFVNISQSRTEQLLDARIAEQPLIEVRWGHRVELLDQDGDGVLLSGPGWSLRTRYALVCAGARAEGLRTQLGVRLDGHSFDDRFLICDIRAELPGWRHERRFYFDPEWNPGRQVLIHPCPDSTYRIDWQVPPDYDLDAEVASGALDRRIRLILGEVPYELRWSSVYRFHTRCVDRFRVGRVLLAGDAAHLYAPFGARGLNSGVADAENAAWKLAFALHGWTADPEALLETYHGERHAAALDNVRVTTATMDFLVPQSPAAARARRDLLRRAAADPTVHALVNSGRLYEPFHYADSPLTTAPAPRTAAHPPAARNPADNPAAQAKAAQAKAAPGQTTPGQTTPGQTTPGQTTPGQTTPGEDAPPRLTPGAILPDLPLPDGGTLRALCRLGLLVLTSPGADPNPAGPDTAEPDTAGPDTAEPNPTEPNPTDPNPAGPDSSAPPSGVPLRVVAMDQLSPELAELLGAGPAQWWLVRPDAHLAAVLTDRDSVHLAVRRVLGEAVDGTASSPEPVRATVTGTTVG